jgi:hypothetical protein
LGRPLRAALVEAQSLATKIMRARTSGESEFCTEERGGEG